jgi:NitT/TauT family transport system substrate-binding protein
MKKIYKYTLTIAVVVIVAVFVFYKIPFSTEDIVVSLKWKHQAQFAGMYVADTKGYYKNFGINVELKEFELTTTQVDDLVQGKTDFAIISLEELLLHTDQGEDIKAVATFYQTSPFGFVSLKEIGINSPADFIGKTLGIKGGKIEEELFYLLLLEKFGISLDRVELKKIGFEKREIDDLRDGDVDIVGLYRTDQLYFFEQEEVDYNIIYPELFGLNVINDVLVATNSMIENNPKLIENFVKGTIKGWKYAIENPDKAVEITLKYVTDENYRDTDYELYILEKSIPLIKPNPTQKIGHIKPFSFHKLYETMRSNGFIKHEFDVLDLYTNDFVDKYVK